MAQHDPKILSKVLEENRDKLERMKIAHRFYQRKAILDKEFAMMEARFQVEIKGTEELIRFLEEICQEK